MVGLGNTKRGWFHKVSTFLKLTVLNIRNA